MTKEEDKTYLNEYAEKAYKTFSSLSKEEQRKVAYRLNWMVKKLFTDNKENKVKKPSKKSAKKKE